MQVRWIRKAIALGIISVFRAHPKTSRKVELSLGQTPVSRGFGMGSYSNRDNSLFWKLLTHAKGLQLQSHGQR